MIKRCIAVILIFIGSLIITVIFRDIYLFFIKFFVDVGIINMTWLSFIAGGTACLPIFYLIYKIGYENIKYIDIVIPCIIQFIIICYGFYVNFDELKFIFNENKLTFLEINLYTLAPIIGYFSCMFTVFFQYNKQIEKKQNNG